MTDEMQAQLPAPDPALRLLDRTGSFDDDGEGFRDGWRPNPGADETVNVPYDIGGRRVG